MSDLQTKFDELLEKQRAIAAEFQQTAQQLFKETTKVFFAENPSVKAIVWNHTPYFNDGESCGFSVSDPYFTNAEGEDLNDISWGEYEGDRDDIWATNSIGWVMNHRDDHYYKDTVALIEKSGGINAQSCDNFANIIQSAKMKNVMLAMFDDHTTIVATAQGFEVVRIEE